MNVNNSTFQNGKSNEKKSDIILDEEPGEGNNPFNMERISEISEDHENSIKKVDRLKQSVVSRAESSVA